MSETTRPARWTEYMALESVLPNPANPKAHDHEQIDASVGRFGYIESITLDERTGCLISGHGRRETLIAMRDRGETAPEGVMVRDSDGAWLVPVARGWASRTDTEALAALVALNRLTEVGGWEETALLDLLDQVSAIGDDAFAGVGFSEDDLDDLRVRLEEIASAEPPTFQGETSDGGEKTDGGFEDNTKVTPSLKEYAANYAEQGRRLIVLECSIEEYPAVTAGLRALREARGVDNNTEAIAGLLAEMFPDAVAEPAAGAEEDALRALGLDSIDPAATLDKEPV